MTAMNLIPLGFTKRLYIARKVAIVDGFIPPEAMMMVVRKRYAMHHWYYEEYKEYVMYCHL